MPEKPESKPRKTKPAEKKPSFWKITFNIVGLLAWVGVVTIACQYAITFGLYFLLGRETLTTPVWTTVCNALIYALATFLIIWVPVRFFKKKKLSRTELGLKDTPTWLDMLLAPAGFIVYLIIASILIAIFKNFTR